MAHNLFVRFLFSCVLLALSVQLSAQEANFDTPNEVCIGESLVIDNFSVNASAYEWDFCEGDLALTPTANAALSVPSATDYVGLELVHSDEGWFGFVSRFGNVVNRISFGTNLTNPAPSVEQLDLSGVSLGNTYKISIVKHQNNWVGVLSNFNGSLIKLDFGESLSNEPIVTPITFTPINPNTRMIDVVEHFGNFYGLLANGTNRVSLISFGTSIGNSATGSPITISGSPTGVKLFFEQTTGIWHGFISAGNITHLTFGNGIDQPPTINQQLILDTPINDATDMNLFVDQGIFYLISGSTSGNLKVVDLGTDLSLNSGNIITSDKLGVFSANLFAINGVKNESEYTFFGMNQSSQQLQRISFPNPCFANTSTSDESHPTNISFSQDGSYSITLTAFNDLGRSSYLTKSVNVSPSFAPDISFSSSNNCIDSENSFIVINNSNNIDAYSWDFDNDGTEDSDLQNPSFQFPATGSYTTRLDVEASNGCNNFATQEITIYDSPITDFSLSGTTCTNTDITITNSTIVDSQAPIEWSWDFDNDGQEDSSEKNPVFRFDEPGSKSLSLTATLADGCADSYIEIVNVLDGPIASFDWTNNCFEEPVQFINQSDVGTNINYEWSFGDEIPTSTLFEPTHSYAQGGQYIVSLNVSDENCTSTSSKVLNVNDGSLADFVVPDNLVENINYTFEGIDQTLDGDQIIDWLWTVNENNFSEEQSTLLSFGQPGQFDVQLAIETSQDCSFEVNKEVTVQEAVFPNVDFSIQSDICIGQNLEIENNSSNATSYLWDFCEGDLALTPTANAALSVPSATDYVGLELVHSDEGWFGFVSRFGNVVNRISFGTNLTNPAPSVEQLDLSGVSLGNTYKISIVKHQNNWVGVLSNFNGSLIKLDFGESLSNEPIVTPITFTPINPNTRMIDVVEHFGNFYGLLANGTNRVSLISFGTSIGNSATGSPITISGSPTGVKLFFEQTTGIWHGFISAGNITHLTFGNGIDQPPTINQQLILDTPINDATDMNLFVDQGIFYLISGSTSGNLKVVDLGTDLSLNSGNIITSDKLGVFSANLFAINGVKNESEYTFFGMNQSSQQLQRISFPNPCFANTSTSDESHPTNISFSQDGSYSITLTAFNDLGRSSYLTKSVNVSPSFAPDISFSSSNNCIDSENSFIVINNSNNIDAYSWDFDNDGTEDSDLQNPSFQFPATGSYTTRLDVEASNGCNNFATQEITIYDSPITDFSLSGTTCTNTDITITNSTIVDSQAPIEWSWDFDNDGQEDSSEKNPVFRFDEPGSKSLSLTATLADGCADSYIEIVNVLDGPIASFDWTNNCFEEPVQFINQSDVGTNINYEWSFGDEIPTSTLFEPTHSYAQGGQYIVSLNVSDENCTITSSKVLNVNDGSLADFVVPDNLVENINYTFEGIDQTLDGDQIIDWLWTVNENNFSEEQSTLLSFGEPGQFDVQLAIETSQDCSFEVNKEVTVQEAVFPNVDFSIQSDICIGQNLEIENNSSNATSYLWDFCEGDLALTPTADAALAVPSATDYVGLELVHSDEGWFGFVSRFGNVVNRISFGTNLTNPAPSVEQLDLSGVSLGNTYKISIVKHQNNWVGVLSNFNGSLIKLDFGESLSNEPIVTPITFTPINPNTRMIDVVEHFGNFYGLLANGTNRVSLISFGTSIGNSATGSPITISGSPTGVKLFFEQTTGIWHGFISAGNITHLTFGNGIDQPPTINQQLILDTPINDATDMNLFVDQGIFYLISGSTSGNLKVVDLGTDLSLNSGNIITSDKLGVFSANLFAINGVKNESEYTFFGMNQSSQQLQRISFPNPCFANTSTSDESHPTNISFSQDGSYSITLTAFNDLGRSSYLTKSVNVSPSFAPDISFSSSNNCIDSENSFIVINNSNNIDAYSWDFDNDGTEDSDLQNPSFQFPVTGHYTTRLDVEASNGCTNSTTQTITIYDPPIASFQEADQAYCADDEILLTNTSAFDGPDSVVTYHWLTTTQSFTATGDTSVVFSEAGEQPIRLTASIPGCESDTLRTISVNASPEVAFDWQNDCLGQETLFINETSGNGVESYLWDLGDGTSATINEPSYTYQAPGKYPVSLTATNDLSCSSTEVDTLVIHALPEVGFEVELACADQPVRFIDTTMVQDANITQWEWVFADQGTSSEQNPEFTFSAPGEYEIELTASSNFECVGTTTTVIQVLKAPAPSIAVEQGCLGDPVLLTDNTTQDEDNLITGYLWEIEDLIFENDSVSYDFPGPGTYPVLLTVDYENLCSVTTTTEVIIEEPIAVAFEHTTACDNDFAQFIDRSVAPGDSIISRTWDFAGLGTANGPTTFFNFAVAGTYDVSLTVTTLKGCTATSTQEVVVNASPIADFSPSTNFGPPPLEVNFFNRSEGATDYLWFVEPSTQPISSEEDASYTFTELGTYTVTLIARNAVGCTDTTSQSIRVDFPLYDLSIDNIQTEVVGDKINIIVRVTNYGTIDINGFDINIDLPGGISLSEPFDQPILHQTSIVQTLNTQLPADTPLEQICISLPATYDTFADERPDNNEACASFRFTALFTDPYPNPSASSTRIDITLPESAPVVMELVSLGGQVVRRAAFNDLSEGLNPVYLDVSNLPFGVYQLRFIHQDGVTMKRVLVRE